MCSYETEVSVKNSFQPRVGTEQVVHVMLKFEEHATMKAE